MMDQSGWRGARFQGHAQGLEGQLRIDVARERPTDAAPTVSIKNHGEIDELAPQPDVS